MLYFTSENPEIATVSDSGIVVGVSVGNTNINVHNSDMSYRGVIPVTVNPAVQPSDRVPVTSIKVEPYRIKLFFINPTSKTLKTTVLPDNATDKSLEWTVSDSEAISCVNGKVRCLKTKEGTFGLTARSKSDPNVLFNCVVEVTKEGTYVKTLTVSPDITNKTIPEEGGEYKVTITVENFNKYFSGINTQISGSEGLGIQFKDAVLSSDKTVKTMTMVVPRNKTEERSMVLSATGSLTDSQTLSIPFKQACCTIANKFVSDSKNSEAQTYFKWNKDLVFRTVRQYEVGSNVVTITSGGQIIYFDCVESQYMNICKAITSDASWIATYYDTDITQEQKSRLTTNGWEKKAGGGMFNIVLKSDNESSDKRTGHLTLPGGLVYTVVQEGKPATTTE